VFPRLVLLDLETAADDLAASLIEPRRQRKWPAPSHCPWPCLDRPGQHASSAGVGGELAELAIARAAAHDVNVSSRPPTSSSHIASVWRNFIARLSRPQRSTAPSSAGTGWPVRWQKRQMAAGMLSGP